MKNIVDFEKDEIVWLVENNIIQSYGIVLNRIDINNQQYNMLDVNTNKSYGFYTVRFHNGYTTGISGKQLIHRSELVFFN
jgi:hypothetical protein